MTLMPFDRIRVADGPTLAVLIAYKALAVIADLAHDAGSFGGGGGFPGVLLRRVFSHQAKSRQQAKREDNCHYFFHFGLLCTKLLVPGALKHALLQAGR